MWLSKRSPNKHGHEWMVLCRVQQKRTLNETRELRREQRKFGPSLPEAKSSDLVQTSPRIDRKYEFIVVHSPHYPRKSRPLAQGKLGMAWKASELIGEIHYIRYTIGSSIASELSQPHFRYKNRKSTRYSPSLGGNICMTWPKRWYCVEVQPHVHVHSCTQISTRSRLSCWRDTNVLQRCCTVKPWKQRFCLEKEARWTW